MSAIQVIQAEQMPAQPWRNGGGQTRELLVWPHASDWQLRISRADIEASGPFSAFAGVQRWFAVLTGNGVVLRMPTMDGHSRDHHLRPGHAPLHFDGGQPPYCQLEDGPTQDLNLMCRNSRACMVAVDADAGWSSDHAQCGLYTVHPGTLSNGPQSLALPGSSLLWLPEGAKGTLHFFPDGKGNGRNGQGVADDGPPPLLAWWLGFTPQTPP
jgi:environmental stress-induced protein Ves